MFFSRFRVLIGVDPAVSFHQQEGDPEGWWEETFKTHTDSKPKGPQAMSVDLEFPGTQHVYGLPERATYLSLEATAGDEMSVAACCLYSSCWRQLRNSIHAAVQL